MNVGVVFSTIHPRISMKKRQSEKKISCKMEAKCTKTSCDNERKVWLGLLIYITVSLESAQKPLQEMNISVGHTSVLFFTSQLLHSLSPVPLVFPTFLRWIKSFIPSASKTGIVSNAVFVPLPSQPLGSRPPDPREGEICSRASAHEESGGRRPGTETHGHNR